MPSNLRKSTPGRTLIGFTALVAFVAAVTARDHRLRASHEGWRFPTALGDKEVMESFEVHPRGAEILKLEGQPLLRVKVRPVTRRDWQMWKAGRDDSKRYFLYRGQGGEVTGAGAALENPGEGPLYIKVRQGNHGGSEFLEVGPRMKEGE